ncbi:peptidase [Achlya hypogyna]|uniref:Peptidase n=1 Tax=Achlya hypogyna TaxID=1202772 RepID=A0A1V9Z5Z5_ACHHY|nr:peptidase [Achlya hypogyna]
MRHLGLLAAALLAGASACTVIVAGKDATVDGSVLVSHTEDTGVGTVDLRIVRVPAMDHAPESNRSVFRSVRPGYPRIVTMDRGPHYQPVDGQALSEPVGHVPQVAHTYAYFDLDYALINEVQLSMGESTCAAKTVGWVRGTPGGHNLFSINELTKIALERCDSARCAVQTMGDLAVEHGFYNDFNGNLTHPSFMSSGESIAVGDKYGEAWIFHVLTGPGNASAVWAAQRVPDDHVSAIANGFVIRQMDLSDPTRFLASANVQSFAKEMGWWRHGPFDFTAAYAYEEPSSPLLPLYVGRRLWRIFDVAAPSQGFKPELAHHATVPTYPFSIKPDKKIAARDVMDLLRDHYEGTPFDLTQGLDAGPFGNPSRNGGATYGVPGGWERAISLDRTIFSFVHQVRGGVPDAIGGITWFGLSSPHGTVFTPFSCAQERVPASYMASRQSRFSTDAAWWAFHFVNNWVQLRFNVIFPEVRAKIEEHQTAALAVYETAAAHALTLQSPAAMAEHMTTTLNAFADDVVTQWWALAWHLVGKYNGGSITTGEDTVNQVSVPYPKWWIETSSFASWPGDTYIVEADLLAISVASADSVAGTAAVYGMLGVTIIGAALVGFVFYKRMHMRRRVYRALD